MTVSSSHGDAQADGNVTVDNVPLIRYMIIASSRITTFKHPFEPKRVAIGRGIVDTDRAKNT